MKKIKLGIVGAAGRGSAFKIACRESGFFEVEAVCDSSPENLSKAQAEFGAPQSFTNYDDLLEQGSVDAVLIATPMPFHVPQASAALQRDIHVLSEVPAGVSISQCEELVRAASKSSAIYMMAENYCYRRPNVLVGELVRLGLFGEPYYGRGEYLHELKQLNEDTPWRRRWQTGINGITYPTHSLGPILRWFGGDRVTSVSYAGSGHHYRDARDNAYELEDTGVMLAKTKLGRLISIRVDMLSERPHAMTNYELQGTEGAYESARDGSDEGFVWLKSLSSGSAQWRPLRELEHYLPPRYKNVPDIIATTGHGGGDYWVLHDFGESILKRISCPIGIHEAMDMTLPGLVSQKSAEQNGAWVSVPDSRAMPPAADRPQLHMVYPTHRREQAPEIKLPPGYIMRQLTSDDHPAYFQLMVKAGFADWEGNESRLSWVQRSVLPDGFFVIEHLPTSTLVATAIASHNPDELHPSGGELGWVAADPAHAGKRLGLMVSSAALDRFLSAGYKHIYLRTDDHRLPAIAIYLRMGFEPFLYQDEMKERWAAVEKKLT